MTIGFALLIFSITVFTVYNLELISKKLPEKFTVVAYIKDGLSWNEVQEIKASLKKDTFVKNVVYISKEQAYRELKRSLKGAEYILEGIEENPLSPSFEIRVNKEVFTMGAVENFIKRLEKMPSVEDIDYGKGFLDFVRSFKITMRIVGVFFSALIFFAIIFVIYSTIKILFYRRNNEIETYKLLGATSGFIRAPFLIEGGLFGFVGGVFASIAAFAFYYALFFKVGKNLALLKYISFPVEVFGILPIVGLVLGLLGTAAAVGRIKF